MADRFTVTIRTGPKVERDHAGTLAAALDLLQRRMEALAGSERRSTVDLRYRRFEPIQQVAVRGEVSGPKRVRGGIDLRGDGSLEAFTGKLRRRVVEQERGETPYAALRRALEAEGGSTSAGP
jgi:hypothetical protein